MITLATGAKPRFIPARAARQAIAERGGKRCAITSSARCVKEAPMRSKASRGRQVGKAHFPLQFTAEAKRASAWLVSCDSRFD
jgi:hypothetical protein